MGEAREAKELWRGVDERTVEFETLKRFEGTAKSL
jgi:hypothetical protein